METKFTYNDIVCIKTTTNPSLLHLMGKIAWIIGVFEEKLPGEYFAQFPEGVVYSIEFEDGSSIDCHEDDLEPFLGSKYTENRNHEAD